MDTVRTGGERDVDAVVHDHRRRGPGKAVHEGAGERHHLSVGHRLRTHLDGVDALTDDGLQQGDRPVVVRQEVGDAVNAG